MTAPVAALTATERHCLGALLYFDIFHYPLLSAEVEQFATGSTGDVAPALERLVSLHLIYRTGDFYSIRPDTKLAERRSRGNQLAASRMRTARRYAALIARFPFVRAVLISGSLSKGYMEPTSDIDYFIITAPGRLWITRTLLAVFRRLVLFNSHRNFCTNYFISSDALAIPENNMFTAVEFSTLIPIHGPAHIRQLREANLWYQQFLPQRTLEQTPASTSSWLQRGAEWLLSPALFARLDGWLMRRAVQYWRTRYASQLGSGDFNIAFQSSPTVSRAHPGFYQRRVLAQWQEKIEEFERQHHYSLRVR